jgi:hypothetical protein
MDARAVSRRNVPTGGTRLRDRKKTLVGFDTSLYGGRNVLEFAEKANGFAPRLIIYRSFGPVRELTLHIAQFPC